MSQAASCVPHLLRRAHSSLRRVAQALRTTSMGRPVKDSRRVRPRGLAEGGGRWSEGLPCRTSASLTGEGGVSATALKADREPALPVPPSCSGCSCTSDIVLVATGWFLRLGGSRAAEWLVAGAGGFQDKKLLAAASSEDTQIACVASWGQANPTAAYEPL